MYTQEYNQIHYNYNDGNANNGVIHRVVVVVLILKTQIIVAR